MPCRTLTTNDAADFQALRLRALRECPTAFASSAEEEADTPLDTVAARLAPRPEGMVFGAFDGDALVGIAGLQRETMTKLAHKAHLWGVYVAPEARRGGHGASLVAEALAHARGAGVLQVTLGVNVRNAAALALYEQLGFTVFGTEVRFLQVGGAWHDEHHMVCRLDAA